MLSYVCMNVCVMYVMYVLCVVCNACNVCNVCNGCNVCNVFSCNVSFFKNNVVVVMQCNVMH